MTPRRPEFATSFRPFRKCGICRTFNETRQTSRAAHRHNCAVKFPYQLQKSFLLPIWPPYNGSEVEMCGAKEHAGTNKECVSWMSYGLQRTCITCDVCPCRETPKQILFPFCGGCPALPFQRSGAGGLKPVWRLKIWVGKDNPGQ